MNLDKSQKLAIILSFKKLLEKNTNSNDYFYQNLLSLDPKFKILFESSRISFTFIEIVRTLVENINSPEKFLDELENRELLVSLNSLSWQEIMTIESALLLTLKQSLSEYYTSFVANSWYALFDLISYILKDVIYKQEAV
jgi:hypothetical protein